MYYYTILNHDVFHYFFSLSLLIEKIFSKSMKIVLLLIIESITSKKASTSGVIVL